ncbi:hypothetical protein CAPTEDRAFT_219969 [Capitella teleta]|uniref:Aldehyde oxidase/xanthine dehydrogenase second molybdopterin binding domain-containing protein n=1 Tax=Capitella teleta TaxID=283909 RepID=R7UEK4_CAPTE|nr:hypothetical protein CAPTEDRAFT_219969 [Capitella teleta]|eukprot:ELU04404.1 hypothetical protein CAPTEDRAFT_219969 [Capitella teleta]
MPVFWDSKGNVHDYLEKGSTIRGTYYVKLIEKVCSDQGETPQLACKGHQKPVRCVFQRDEDTTIIGGRHPMLATYKVCLNNLMVLDWAMLQGDGAYFCPNVLWSGHVCKTNIRSPAGFRGYGGPQGAFFYKTLINHVAAELGRPLERVQETNLYVDGSLTPYHQTMTDTGHLHRCWKEIKNTANFNTRKAAIEIFNRVPGVYNFDWSDPAFTPPFRYFTNGAMCSEVEVDLLTGTYLVRRIDIVMDVGQSLNPAIDVGQIEGAFVQGMGWHTTEEENWSDDGKLLSTNYDKYTVPKASDIPSEFNVTLLKDSENPKAVYSSKGIGEPGILGASSVLFALQEALVAALRDAGHLERPIISETPFTAEKVRKFLVEHGIVPIQQ